jgi:hypothetical protein
MKALIKFTASLVCMFLFIQAEAQFTPTKLNNPTDIKSGTNISTVGSSTDQGESSGASYERAEENLGEECSMYLNKNWSKGKIILNDNTVINEKLLRYNLYSQQMEFINDKDTAALGNPDEIASINFDEHSFIYNDYECHNKLKKGYFEVLIDGNCKLLLFRCIKYKYIEECADPNAELIKETFYMEKKYFIVKGNKPAIQIPKKKKDVIELFSDKKDMNSFIKKNKIKIDKQDDLIKLVNYYNET